MPDISMCANGDSCPLANTCYRFRAVPNEYRQAYSDFFKEGEDCKHYQSNLYGSPTAERPAA